MSDSARFRLSALVKLVATIVVAGALVAGLMLPLVGGTGLVARNSASLLDALPSELTDRTPAGNSKVLASDGSLITNFYANNRTPVAADQIAPVMKQALVDIEDSRFYEHKGLDVQGTVRALVTNVAAGTVREGGSTLTQQLVKQTLLQTAATPEERQAATEQTPGRKLREARLALALEEKYSKDEILTRYLNIVYFGNGAYGIQAAARTYFSVDAKDLSLPQASMLAGLVQSPTNDDPISQPQNATKRRDQVLQRMHDLGHINDADLQANLGQPVAVAPSPAPANGCIYAAMGGFFCAYLRDYLVNKLGITVDQLENGGLTVQTTLRPDMQAAGDQGVLNTLPMGDNLAGMYTAVQPGTGHVLAMSVNRRYGCGAPECESVVLNTVASQGSGSTYKVFTAAAALARGIPASYTMTTGSRYTSHVFTTNGAANGPAYSVENASPNYPPTLNMEQALYMSANTYFVALEDTLGSVEDPVHMAEAMGMHFDQPNQTPADRIIAEKRGSFTLGAEATSPLDLASAYSTLAANGTRCDPTPVTAVLDRSGKPLTGTDGQPVLKGDSCTPQAIPPNVADTLNQILRRDVEPGNPGQTAVRAYVPGHQIAGKTGTSQNNFSVSFVGYTPEYAASVMVLDPKKNTKITGFGGDKGANIWHDAMTPILSNQQTAAFPPADPALAANGRFTGPGASQAPPTDQGNGGTAPPADQGNGGGDNGTGNGTDNGTGTGTDTGGDTGTGDTGNGNG